MKDYEDVDDLYKVLSETLNNAYDRGYEKGQDDKPIMLVDEENYERGLIDTLNALRKIASEYKRGFSYVLIDGKHYGTLEDCLFGATIEDVKVWIKRYLDKQDTEKDDWYEIPTDRMTEEQLRQAVKELRKALSERV